MCRWLAYSGAPIAISEIVFNTQHSLIDQSLCARSSVQTTNGDGFGVGWYDECEYPGLYKHIQPAWNNPNLKDLCVHTQSPMFLAHIRAATATSIQQTNCHPFRYKQWLFVHNGVIREFHKLRRDIAFSINAGLFPEIVGTTDSELMFFLALQLGMENDVCEGVSRMVGLIEDIARRHGVDNPMQMTLGISDGEKLYAFRYSSEKKSRTLFHSTSITALRELVPPEFRERLEDFSDDARVIVSEPFSDLPEAWQAIPESSFVTIEAGEVLCREFSPVPPKSATVTS